MNRFGFFFVSDSILFCFKGDKLADDTGLNSSSKDDFDNDDDQVVKKFNVVCYVYFVLLIYYFFSLVLVIIYASGADSVLFGSLTIFFLLRENRR